MDRGDKKTKLSPIEEVLRMPQLMYVPHNHNLFSTMNKFRLASKQSKEELRRRKMKWLNPDKDW
jgi:hypothetical protein